MAPGAAKMIYPDLIRGWITPTEGDIVNMEIPESPVFDGITPLDLRYFNDNQRDNPHRLSYGAADYPGSACRSTGHADESTWLCAR